MCAYVSKKATTTHYISRSCIPYTVAAPNKDNPAFSKGASCSCPPEARDPAWIPLDLKDDNATRYRGSPNRVFCRPFLSLSR